MVCTPVIMRTRYGRIASPSSPEMGGPRVATGRLRGVPGRGASWLVSSPTERERVADGLHRGGTAAFGGAGIGRSRRGDGQRRGRGVRGGRVAAGDRRGG